MTKVMTAGVERDRPAKSEASVSWGEIVTREPNAAGDAAATRETEQIEKPRQRTASRCGDGAYVRVQIGKNPPSPGRFASRVPSE